VAGKEVSVKKYVVRLSAQEREKLSGLRLDAALQKPAGRRGYNQLKR